MFAAWIQGRLLTRRVMASPGAACRTSLHFSCRWSNLETALLWPRRDKRSWTNQLWWCRGLERRYSQNLYHFFFYLYSYLDSFKARFHLLKQERLLYRFTTRCRCFAHWTNLNERRWCHWTKLSCSIDLFFYYDHFACWCWSRDQLPRGEGKVSPGRVASLLQGHAEIPTAWSWELKNSEDQLRN